MSPPTRGEAPAATPGASSKQRSRRPRANRTAPAWENRVTAFTVTRADAERLIEILEASGVQFKLELDHRPHGGASHAWRPAR